jgi:hypothetical protein
MDLKSIINSIRITNPDERKVMRINIASLCHSEQSEESQNIDYLSIRDSSLCSE